MNSGTNNNPLTSLQKEMQLSSNWAFRQVGTTDWMTATVPGCVHTDLIHHAKIPDPSYRKNELVVKWVEDADWEYKTTFNVSAELFKNKHKKICFDGLDTYADVYLNEIRILTSDNMYIPWMKDVNNLLRVGENTLRIYFHSAVKVGLEKLSKIPYVLMAANEIAPPAERSNVVTRKAPFHYGWDWGPRLVTCGIWKNVKLQVWNDFTIESLYVKPVNITTDRADYNAIVEIEGDSVEDVTIELRVDNQLQSLQRVFSEDLVHQVIEIPFSIHQPELWWTNGLGGQKLYNIEVRIVCKDIVNESVAKRIGVRTLELVQEKDAVGRSFLFKLNGVPVFMKGANYIPSDIFVTKNTLENYQRVIQDAINANMNMLRIWGGAIYENDELYDLMDEYGLLAWNDFMFACNVQPNDNEHLENIRKEAEYNVKRLRNHPSIALWCGNNENLSAWFDWGWSKNYSDTDRAILWDVYQKLYYQILSDAVEKFHPEISYWPSSPQAYGNKVPDRLSGDEHDWSVWFGLKPFSAYNENIPRFVSEYGIQSFPEIKTIKAFANEEDMEYQSEIMEHRQRSYQHGGKMNGNGMMKLYIDMYYKSPENFESFVYLSQLMQAEGVKIAIESHRRNMPHCMGTLYWQINDCWPTMSWASVDYFGRWKALHYFIKKVYHPTYPIIFRNHANIEVFVVNDKMLSERAEIKVMLCDFAGKTLWEQKEDAFLASNTSQLYLSFPEKELLAKADATQMFLKVDVIIENQPPIENIFYFVEAKYLGLNVPEISKDISKTASDLFEIILRTNTLVKNIALSTKQTEGRFSDNYFDMLPGKDYKIFFEGNAVDLESEMQIINLNTIYNNGSL